jgi:hypothetical protein
MKLKEDSKSLERGGNRELGVGEGERGKGEGERGKGKQ